MRNINDDPEHKIFKRIQQATGLTRQVDIAEYFGVRQSSISDAYRHRRIPDSWLLPIVASGVSLHWLLTGEGPMETFCNGKRHETVPLDTTLDFIISNFLKALDAMPDAEIAMYDMDYEGKKINKSNWRMVLNEKLDALRRENANKNRRMP